MKNCWLKIFEVCVAGALAVAAQAAETTTRVGLSDLSDSAQKTIRDHVGNGKVQEIDKIVHDGDVTYEAILKKGNRERTITVGEDGQLLDIEVFLNETPGP